MPSIDIGANLSHESFAHDREPVIQRARDAGVQAIIVTGSCRQSTLDAIALAKQHAGFCYATAGLHPHHAAELTDELCDFLQQSARQPEVVAMGEMGLDFFRDIAPRDVQERSFHRQLEIAIQIGKPLFLHERDAFPRFADILREYRAQLRHVVVHCFTGQREALHRYLELDCHIGITGWVCDERRGRHLLDLVRDIPPARLLVETDAPYLLPRTLARKPSDRRNEPQYLGAVIDTIALARGESPQALAKQTTDNARAFFALP